MACIELRENQVRPIEGDPLSFSFNGSERVVVTPYWYPDLDGFASAFAVQEYLMKVRGIPATAKFSMTPQLEVQWISKKLGVPLEMLKDTEGKTKYVLVDVSDPEDLPPQVSQNLDTVVSVIDHRPYGNIAAFPQARVQIEQVGAAASLITRKFMQHDLPPSRIAAQLLLAAIASNTVNCKAHHYTPDDKAAYTWLDVVHPGLNPLIQEMFAAKTAMVKEDVDTAIRLDISSKSPRIFEQPTVVGQLEVLDPRDILASSGSVVQSTLKAVQVEREAVQAFLIMTNLADNTDETILVSPDSEMLERLCSALGGKIDGEYCHISDTLTRKEIISILLHLSQ